MSPPQYSQPLRDLQPPARSVRLGSARVDLATHTVFRESAVPVRLSPKAVQVLLVLLTHGNKPVHREHLIARAWPGQFRTDDVVTKAILELRRALSDSPEQSVIETIPRVGYWLKLSVEWLEDSAEHRPPTADTPGDAQAAPNAADSLDERSGKLAASDVTLSVSRAVQSHGGRSWTIALIVALPIVGIALAAIFPRGGSDYAGPTAATSLASAVVAPRLNATPLSTDPGDEAYAAISPDGALVAIAANSTHDTRYRLRLRAIAGGDERLLMSAGAGDELAPTWSPDSRMLAYYRIDGGDCALEIVDVLGLKRRALARCVPGLLAPAEFVPDGSAVLMPWIALANQSRKTGFARIDLVSGQVSNFDYGGSPIGFELEVRFSPDGGKLLVQHGVAPFSSVTVFDLDRTHPQPPSKLGERFGSINGMTWLSDNRHAVVASDNAGVMELWRVDTISGEVERFGGLSGQFPSAAKNSDLLVYSHLDRTSGLTLLHLQLSSDQGERSAIFASTRAERAPAITADGKRLAFVSDRMGSAQIYLGDWSSDRATPISDLKAGQPFDLSFSSDGRQLSFSLRLDGLTDVKIMDLDTRALSEPELGVAHTIDMRFGSEYEQLLFTSWDQDDRPHIYAQRQHDPASARRLSTCVGRAPRSGGDGWIYFLSRGMLKRVRIDGVDAPCEVVSDRVHWLNRNAWIADSSGVIAVLTPRDRVARPGLYRLSEPPQLLIELPELSRRPLGSIDLVGNAERLIAALPPLFANADVWLVRGLTQTESGRSAK